MPLAIVMVGPPEITIEFSVAATTDSGVFPLTVPSDDVAVIVIAVLLIVRAVTNPPAEIVATAVFDDVHVAVAVRSCVDLSLYVPVAANCVRVPTGTEAFAGVTAIDCSTGAVTVSAAVPTTLFTVAVIVVDPGVKVVADPPGAIVATDVLDEFHVAVIVRSLVVLLLYVPRAVNARGRPAATDAVNRRNRNRRKGWTTSAAASRQRPCNHYYYGQQKFFHGGAPLSKPSFFYLKVRPSATASGSFISDSSRPPGLG